MNFVEDTYALPFYHERRPILIDLVLKDDPVTYLKYSNIIREGEHVSAEITLPHFNNGTGISLWFIASPLYNNQGTIVGAIESIRDITESKKAELTLNRKHDELQAAYEQIYASEEELRLNYDELAKQRQELRKSEHLLHAMSSNIPVVVYRMHFESDGSYQIDYISERCMEILGIEPETTDFPDLFRKGLPDQDLERYLTSIQYAVSTQTLWIFESQFSKPSGEKIWLKVVSSPVIEDDILYFDGVIFDDTERRQKDEFIRLLAHISDISPASITVHDFDGNMLYANEQTFKLHGYTRDEFLSKNLHEIDVPETEQLIAERMQILREKGTVLFDAKHYHKDGSIIPLRVHVKIVEWEKRSVLLSIAMDLTGSKRSEDSS